jgi:hypothetical protein
MMEDDGVKAVAELVMKCQFRVAGTINGHRKDQVEFCKTSGVCVEGRRGGYVVCIVEGVSTAWY